MIASHSSAFKPAAVSGARSGGAFSAVGTGKMSLNNMLSSGADTLPTAAKAIAPGVGNDQGAASMVPSDNAPSIAGIPKAQHETIEERKARRRKEKKKKRKREKKEQRREEKRLRREAALARTAAYRDPDKKPATPLATLPEYDASADAGAHEATASAGPSSTDGHQSESNSDGEEEKPSVDTSHLVQSKNSRGRPQRSAAVAAEAISAASNAKTDREARREERERRER